MDTEAKIILDDTISFCERDERDGRLINILGQCVPVELTETSLTIEAPTRFAYSYLLKQRAIIERYLEEITFGPLALNVTVPESITAGHRGVADPSPRRGETAPAPAVVSRETYEQAEAAAPAVSDASVHAGAPSDAATFTGAPSHSDEAATSEAHEAHRLSLGAPADGGSGKVKVTNVLSPDAFRQLTSAVHASEQKPAEVAKKREEHTPDSPEQEQQSVHVHSKFTFENFVYGDENKHAYQSAVRFAAMADEPGTCTSLFIYGKSGLGKTHLLLAIKNYLNEHSPHLRVKYANSQTYVEDYISELAISKNRAGIILREYHDADVLIIDDIQNIIGKTQSIENFFSLMDEFIRNNKKIAIASDRAPKNLGMDERLTSRFNAGMLCLVSEPGFEMKYMICLLYTSPSPRDCS